MKEEGLAGATRGGPGGGAWLTALHRCSAVPGWGQGQWVDGLQGRPLPAWLCLERTRGVGGWPLPVHPRWPPRSITETYLPSLPESPPPLDLHLPAAGEAGVFQQRITWPDPSLREPAAFRR